MLDSEGIDAATGEGHDDNQIFTLTVLLASVLIYNSQGVPTRRDLDGLEYPLKYSSHNKKFILTITVFKLHFKIASQSVICEEEPVEKRQLSEFLKQESKMVIDYSNLRLRELCMQEFVTTNPVTEIKQFRNKVDKCRFSFKVKNTLSFNSNVEFIRN